MIIIIIIAIIIIIIVIIIINNNVKRIFGNPLSFGATLSGE